MLLVHKFYQFSEDKEKDTLEFNEYLTMLGLQNIEQIQYDSLLEALRFKYCILLKLIFFDNTCLRVFDKDEDDHLSIMELKKVLTTMGQRMKKKEFEEMIKSTSVKENGLIHLQGTIYKTR